MTGISEVVFSAFDIDRIAAPLMQIAGYRRVELADASPAERAAWHVPESCTRVRQVLLQPPEERGALRIVQFEGVERRLIRSSQRTWDTGGIFDLDLFARDVRGIYAELQRDFGWTAFGDPVDYVMGEFDVTQVVAIGPDGLVLALIEPHKRPSFPMPSYDRLSRIFNSTQLVRSLDAALDFYCGTLGWQALVRIDVADTVEPGADVLGLPMPFARTLQRRVAIVHPTGSNDGSVELIEIAGLQGQDRADLAVAPNVGLLALRLEVPDARAYSRELEERGVAFYTAPTDLEVAPWGETTLFSVRSPDGAILEFHSRRRLEGDQ